MASTVDDSEAGRFHNASLATSVATRRRTAANTDNNKDNAAALNATGLSLPLSVQTDTFVSVKRERTAHSVDNTLGNEAASPLDSLKLLQQKLDKIGAKRHNVGRVARTEVAGIQLEAEAYDARLDRLQSVGQDNGHGGRATGGALRDGDNASKLGGAPAVVEQRKHFGSVERLRVDPRPPYAPSSQSYHSRGAAVADSPLAENNYNSAGGGGGGERSDDARSRSRHSVRQLKKMEDYKRRLKLEYKFVKEKYMQLSNETKRGAKEPIGGATPQANAPAKRGLASATKVLFADENTQPNARAADTNMQQCGSGQAHPHKATFQSAKNAIAQTSILPNINERGNVAISEDFADLKRRLADMQQRFLNELDKHDNANQRESAEVARVPAAPVQRSPCRQRRVRIAAAASCHADALVDAPIAPKARLHFVPAKATGASHSLNANLQQFLSSLKSENPLLHHVCLRVGAHAPISKLIHACSAELAKRHQLLQADLDRKLRVYTAVKERLDAMAPSHGHSDAEVASAAADVHDGAHQVELSDAALLRLDRQMARLDSLADTLRSPLAADVDRCGARKHRHASKVVRAASHRRSVVPATLTQATIASECKAQRGHRAAQANVDGAQHQRHTAALRNLRRLTDAMRA